MNTKLISSPDTAHRDVTGNEGYQFKVLEPLLLFVVLLLLWSVAPVVLQHFDKTSGSIDQSIWLLVILGMISFLLLVALSWWLLQHFWTMMGLPKLNIMVSQFKTLALWQQLSFLWGSFALLLLAATGCLAAIC